MNSLGGLETLLTVFRVGFTFELDNYQNHGMRDVFVRPLTHPV
jgi:hypothetical protein